ncbi:GNAT family N-acetyltransferase [Paenibacillus sp. N3.4]|uniref:GNAT family N-acetyltransferase n=1 Tax=Paenibacillus sp. N3.4 TaxID=2603222 RepID=UPI0011C851AB|nr:GNAT family N-acetyltransferase [Paenibacillus sp. N3.4]TXK75131.1 GNAT family N-acetyltransferase [Paenibacillus sp. N3.4]
MIRKRLASIDDSAIHRLVVEQLVPYSRTFDPSKPITLTEIRKRLKQTTTFVMAKSNKQALGFISLLSKSHILFIDMLAVDPREQRRGWGHKLMQTAEQYGKRERCHTAELLVDDSNPKALQFYLNRGYNIKEYVSQLNCYMLTKRI